MPLPEQFDKIKMLDAWAEALLALVALQRELEEASADMTAKDDWSWQNDARALVKEVWQVIATTPADKRLEVARGYREMALQAAAFVSAKAQEEKEPE